MEIETRSFQAQPSLHQQEHLKRARVAAEYQHLPPPVCACLKAEVKEGTSTRAGVALSSAESRCASLRADP
jgi:hypothetical protein